MPATLCRLQRMSVPATIDLHVCQHCGFTTQHTESGLHYCGVTATVVPLTPTTYVRKDR